MSRTEKDLNDVILAWVARRNILLAQDSIDDLTQEIIRLGPFISNQKKEIP